MENVIAHSKQEVTDIAKVCHQANKAFCESEMDYTQKDWSEAQEWQKDSAIYGVIFRLNNPDAEPSAQHDSWQNQKIKDGWVWGEEKDETRKTHPCLVPYDQLPEFQRKKDKLFQSIVDALK